MRVTSQEQVTLQEQLTLQEVYVGQPRTPRTKPQVQTRTRKAMSKETFVTAAVGTDKPRQLLPHP